MYKNNLTMNHVDTGNTIDKLSSCIFLSPYNIGYPRKKHYHVSSILFQINKGGSIFLDIWYHPTDKNCGNCDKSLTRNIHLSTWTVTLTDKKLIVKYRCRVSKKM